MFQTISNIQNGKAVLLQQPIDNREGKLRVGLRSITYTVGWFNVGVRESFACYSKDTTTRIDLIDFMVPPGLYSFAQLKDHIETSCSNSDFALEVNKVNGFITLDVGAGCEVLLTDGISNLLGLKDGLGFSKLSEGVYTGDRSVNFSHTKSLHIYLDQLNTSGNIVDGAPSMLLTTVGLEPHSFGDVNTIRFENPEFKRLQSGTVNELKVSIKDDRGEIIDNHGLPISVVLEIK